MNQLAVVHRHHHQDHQWFRFGRENNFMDPQDGPQPWMGSMDDPTPSSSPILCSLDTKDDASSSSSPTSCSSSNGPPSLFDMSSLKNQLPTRKGLSRFYNGKSESFTSLSEVTSIQDLPKKETPYTRRKKGCKSLRAGLDAFKSHTSPTPIITKKASPSSPSSSSSQSTRAKASFISSSRNSKPPLVPVKENHP
ncbi:unnamed protein product [Cuscuta campestris]|uniref:Uncharacterized protein n=1 Tax=Cuscuta campestris TaxID=132261 RepID=A0A484M2P6_9ASTE|nr:unnamed protein product [Cuscuta campestris]